MAMVLTQARALAAAALIGAALTAGAANAQQKTVNVYNWSDYIAEDATAKFTAATGVKVNYDVYDNNEVVEAKLSAGKSGYDVVTPSSFFAARQLRQGRYQPLDRSKIPNYGNLEPEMMKLLEQFDPGNQHFVPWMIGTVGLGHNVDKVKKLVPDAPVDSLALIFDPAVMEKLKSCGVMMLDSPSEVIAAALTYLKLPADSKDPAHLEKAAEVVAKIRPYVRKFHSSEYINALANGDICVAFGYSGDVLQAAARGAASKKKTKVEYHPPKEGALIAIDVMGIPKDAPHPDEAHAWINFLLTPEIAAASSDLTGYANANSKAFPLVKPEVRDNPVVYLTAAMRERMYIITPAAQEFEKLRNAAWRKIKTGR